MVRDPPGQRLDLLRAEAYRAAKANGVKLHVDRAEIGTQFCYDNEKAKTAFALVCEKFGIWYDGQRQR
ncbi:hypothetical protein BSZ22_31270 [Bradyrhizobium canariense]|uniref:Uncharacterized protein n=1 Tax=Bradyrhizobium canariense TaxID=255045 RepID=A0A1X3F1A3_9BRAD|nr:hypothetical protein BSZ21_38560 [Bradyrhizobium canariense]OSI65522.1 hypothetical protein BSZ22_31270 [Bradyrhizobium canariense]OSI76033.1 hypothetical protein BSZ23_27370 [Bradyrhizobium canariense]OSI85679.1 hypothetical protein BSZ24_31500 [Bradyrhizobium canariense]OSI87179.1 hypothetical protein BSZ25_28200 [Bradyrhizobium canariense]